MTDDKPLAGIRVLDLTRLLPGPLCTQHLGDMGADVLKVEEPGQGDYARWIGRPLRVNSADFVVMNRSKRSMTLDLKRPEAVALFLRLTERADVVVEGFRPGVVDRLGIGWDAVRAVNPRLVYASISGYGQTGPMAAKAGHDLNYMALSGVLDQIGRAGGPPAIPNFQIGDIAGGALSAAMAICAALVGAQRSGKGRWLDIPITDCIQANAVIPAAGLARGEDPPARGADMLTGALPCYDVYATADGRWLAVGALEPKFWIQVCTLLGRPDLADKGHVTGTAAAECRAAVAAIIGSRPLSHWEALFASADCCVTPVLTPAEAASRARGTGLAVTHDHPVEGPVAQFAFPIRMDGRSLPLERPAPMQGEHTDAVLAELGLDAVEMAALRAAGVV